MSHTSNNIVQCQGHEFNTSCKMASDLLLIPCIMFASVRHGLVIACASAFFTLQGQTYINGSSAVLDRTADNSNKQMQAEQAGQASSCSWGRSSHI